MKENVARLVWDFFSRHIILFLRANFKWLIKMLVNWAQINENISHSAWKSHWFSISRLINASDIRLLIWMHPSGLHGHSTQKQVMRLNKQLNTKQLDELSGDIWINFLTGSSLRNIYCFDMSQFFCGLLKTRPCKFCSRHCNGPKVHLTFQGLI